MKKNPLTASERRGILIVAGIALLLTGGGWIVSRCQRPPIDVSPQEVTILMHGDSLSSDKDKMQKKRKRKTRKDSVSSKKKKVKKTYRQRNPLEEPV